MDPIRAIYPIPKAIYPRLGGQEIATLNMLAATLKPGGSNRQRTKSEHELEATVQRMIQK